MCDFYVKMSFDEQSDGVGGQLSLDGFNRGGFQVACNALSHISLRNRRLSQMIF